MICVFCCVIVHSKDLMILFVACKGQKRKSNSDSGSELTNGSTTPVSQKKPRLFFTEDQKTALSQAYITDPYPNQAAIERLAADIGVGVKTVVNWFHNHRMRAKQQPLNSTDLLSSSTQSVSFPVKTETGVAGTLCHNADQRATVDSLPEGTESHGSDGGLLPVTSESIFANARMTSSSAARKRKRAKPHRLSTGIVLDRTEQQVVTCDTDSCHGNDSAAANELCSADSQAESDNSKWVEAERERNIERLQRNLEQEPVVDWEF